MKVSIFILTIALVSASAKDLRPPFERPIGIMVANQDKCQHIGEYHLYEIGTRTAKLSFLEIEKDEITYKVISCPNTGKPYALIAGKNGADTEFSFGLSIRDSTLLATGYNIAYTVECGELGNTAKAANGRTIEISGVACVELPEPSPIHGY